MEMEKLYMNIESQILKGIENFLKQNGYETSFSPNLQSKQTQIELARAIKKEINFYLKGKS